MLEEAGPLHYAMKSLEFAKIIVPKAHNLNHQNKSGATALHCATRNIEVFKYLMSLDAKINPNVGNKCHQLPLHYVCFEQRGKLNLEERTEIVKCLVSVTLDTDQKDSFNKSPLDYARENGFAEIVKILSEKSIDNFLSKVCNYPNNPDINGRLPIHEVSMQNSLSFELNMEGRFELMKTLIILTTNINIQDTFGNTALHYAVENGFSELVKMLAKKCDPLIRNENGYTPIELAILNNDVEIVEILAPVTKTFKLDGILLRPEVRDNSWKCFEILNQITRKRKGYFDHVQSLKKARYQ